MIFSITVTICVLRFVNTDCNELLTVLALQQ
jgi:hypothetical protein